MNNFINKQKGMDKKKNALLIYLNLKGNIYKENTLIWD